MKQKRTNIKGGIAVDDTHERQLMALLQEMVREKGYSGTARVLEIDRRTVASCMKKGRLSRRVRQVLERAIQYGAGSAAAEQRERNDKLEGRVNRLEERFQNDLKEMNKALEKLEKAHARERRRVERRLAAMALSGDGPESNEPDANGSGDSATRSGPPWWRPHTLRERPSASVIDLILEWRQALTRLMAAEERLSRVLDRDVKALVHSHERSEAPAEPRTPRPARRARKLPLSREDEGDTARAA